MKYQSHWPVSHWGEKHWWWPYSGIWGYLRQMTPTRLRKLRWMFNFMIKMITMNGHHSTCRWNSTRWGTGQGHYSAVIMNAMVSQIIVSIVCSNVCSGADQKHQSSVSLAFVSGIHRWPVNLTFYMQFWTICCAHKTVRSLMRRTMVTLREVKGDICSEKPHRIHIPVQVIHFIYGLVLSILKHYF